ncbi:MAG: hypothetical protein AAGG47_17895 [Pseudomonadota bacterium]
MDGDFSRPMGGHDEREPLSRLPKNPPVHYTHWLVPLLALASGLLVGFAATGLIDADSLLDYLKGIVLAVMAAAVSYGTTRLAIEKGTRQAAIGTPWAAASSLGAMLLVGTALGTASYAGFTKPETDAVMLEAFGRDLGIHVAERVEGAQDTRRIAPALTSALQIFEEAKRCERESNCISGGNVPGEGPVFDAVAGEARQAQAVVAEAGEGVVAFDAALEQLRGLQAWYGEIVADGGLSSAQKRRQAQKIAGDISAQVAVLEEAAPVALAAAYASSLRLPADIQGRPEASVRLNALRFSQAARLEAVKGSIERGVSKRPVFPAKAGVADTLGQIGRFLPIGLIIGTVELAFPLLLWLTTYFGYVGRIDGDGPPDAGEDVRPGPKTRRRETDD